MSELLRAEEVAARLRISRAQVYAMASRGELPVIRLGEHAVRFPADALQAWLAKQITGGADLVATR